jgi:Autographiviridae endonuclease
VVETDMSMQADVSTDDCQEWDLGRTTDGYGHLRLNGGYAYAHRLVWEEVNGPIPVGLFVLHRCDNPPCINIDHLFLGTQEDNVRDMVTKGRARGKVAPGEQNGMAKLTNDVVREIRRRSAAGVNYSRLASDYDVSKSLICAVVRRQTWKHVA